MKKNIFFTVIFRIIYVLAIFLTSGQSYGQQKSAKDMCTDFLANSSITVLQFDSVTCRCYVDITYNWPWVPTGANPDNFPYGIDIAAFDVNKKDVIVEITNVVKISGFDTWSTCSPAGNNPEAFSSIGTYHFYGWRTSGKKANPDNAIPSTSTLKFRVYLNFTDTKEPITMWFRVLNWKCKDAANPSDPEQWWACKIDAVVAKPLLKKLSLTVDCQQVCNPSHPYTELHLVPAQTQSPCNQWDWYRHILKPGESCPSTNPWSPDWGNPIMNGGNSLMTGIMDTTCCYAVRLTQNCFTSVTKALQVTVCPDPSTIGGIVVSPVTPYSNLELKEDSAAYYACGSWNSSSKTFTAPGMGFCNATVKWYIDSTGTWQSLLSTSNQYVVNASAIRFSCPLNRCYKVYLVKAEITYDCCVDGVTTQQVATSTARIVINSPTKAGYITSERWDMCGSPCPLPPPSGRDPVLCYDRGTILHYNGKCYRVDRWDSSSSTGWVQIQGAGNQSEWWTNKLRRTTNFRVTVHNGVCPSDTSPPIIVRVKPKLIAKIEGCTMLCQGQPCKLKSSTSYTEPGYKLKYYWYKDGTLLTPLSPSPDILLVKTPGNYTLQVKDPVCGTDTLSNTVTICEPGISFIGRPCFCDSETFTIIAVPNACYTNNCSNITYKWTGPGGFTSTDATIKNGVTGIYKVTVNCGSMLCPITGSINITNCP
jgi:hypothetical protein